MSAGSNRAPGRPDREGRRALAVLLRPRGRRSEWLIAALCALLGFALAVQVHTTRATSGLATARQEDLVRILDDLTGRADRLRSDVDALRATSERLSRGDGQAANAIDEARQRAQTLGILAGTVPATGPGTVLTVTDPQATVRSDVLLGAVEELRGAGAEAIQLDGASGGNDAPADRAAGPVRIVAATYLIDRPGGVEVDGRVLRAPYQLSAIGDLRTLATALDIPGGVLDTVRRRAGATATVSQRDRVDVTALRPAETPRYARPAPEGDATAFG